jgi:hypothetical protein
LEEAMVMASVDSRGGRSVLDAALDIFRVRQYFNVVVGARDVTRAVRTDAKFLDTREWPQFMRAGREAMLASLRQHTGSSAA